jgi:hypothetical protein
MTDVKRGFSCGNNASLAAKRNHELGTAHRFTPAQAADAGRIGMGHRWAEKHRNTSNSALTAPSGPVTPKSVS